MSYQRKQEDKRRLRKMMNDGAGWGPSGAYEAQRSQRKPHLKRYGKSQGKNSCGAWNKRQAHKTYRRFIKQNNFYSKKAYDLWGNVW